MSLKSKILALLAELADEDPDVAEAETAAKALESLAEKLAPDAVGDVERDVERVEHDIATVLGSHEAGGALQAARTPAQAGFANAAAAAVATAPPAAPAAPTPAPISQPAASVPSSAGVVSSPKVGDVIQLGTGHAAVVLEVVTTGEPNDRRGNPTGETVELDEPRYTLGHFAFVSGPSRLPK
jgi:hypothetical protein